MPLRQSMKTDSGRTFVNFATVRSTVNRCSPRASRRAAQTTVCAAATARSVDLPQAL
jgi:hypothetical protein